MNLNEYNTKYIEIHISPIDDFTNPREEINPSLSEILNTAGNMNNVVCNLMNSLYNSFRIADNNSMEIDFCIISMYILFIISILLALGTSVLFAFMSANLILPIFLITQMIFMFFTSFITDYTMILKLISGLMFVIGIGLLTVFIITNQNQGGGQIG